MFTKMVVVQKHQIASEEWLIYARAFLAPGLQQSTPLEPKGVPKRIGRNRPTNEDAGTDKKRTRIEAKASMAYSELVSDDDSGTTRGHLDRTRMGQTHKDSQSED